MLDYRIATLCGFTKNITASAAEKLGYAAILGTEDGYIKILDLTTRRIVRTIKAHASEITYLQCIGRDQMCVSSSDGTLSLWSTVDFHRISVLQGHRHNVTCCCSDPDGYILYSSGWDNSVRLWSAKDGRSISVIEDFRWPVNWIDHHPHKQMIACGLWNGNVEIWDTVSLERKTVFPSFNGSVQCLAYTQDGINIVSSYINSEITIWSSEAGFKISCLRVKGHILPVKSLASLPSDNIFVSGSDDCTLKVWTSSHKSHFMNITDTKSCSINLMEFISENLLAVSFQNGEISVFDTNNGNAISKVTLDFDVVSVLSKHSSTSNSSKEFEKLLVFGTQSGKLMSGKLLDSSVTTVMEFPSKLTAVIHTSEMIICGTSEGDIGILLSEKKLSKITSSAHKSSIGSLCLQMKTEKFYILSSGNDNILKLWSTRLDDSELMLEKEFINEHRDAITTTLLYSPSPTSSINILTGSYDNNVILWDKNSSFKVLQGLQSAVWKIAASDEYILGCGHDGALVMWHQNGTILMSIPGIDQSSAILAFYLEADDSSQFDVILAYVDLDGSIKIDKPLQQSYYCSFDGHSKPITSCCVTENKEVVSCSFDGSVNLWKIPLDVSDGHLMHDSSVTGLILASPCNFALSSDANGNLIFWKINLQSLTSPLLYSGKKKYNQGFIKGLSWLKNNKFACAVSQTTDIGEKNFLDILQFDLQKSAFSLKVRKSYKFESQVYCFNSCDQTDRIVIGLKSGDVIYITPETYKCFKMCEDWILSLSFLSKTDLICISDIDGCLKLYPEDRFLSCKDKLPKYIKQYKASDKYKKSKFTSVMCCGIDELIIGCGDSDGVLRIYDENSLKFNKKVHEDIISGMCVIDSYLFTSSLDKTVKGWSLKTLKQVCQFHSHAPVSCLSSMQRDLKDSKTDSIILLLGAMSGNVHLLQFHPLQ